MSNQLRHLIARFAAQKTTPFSLRELWHHGRAAGDKRVLNAKFLHRELPIRLASRLQELNNLPAGLTHNGHVQKIIGWYSGYLLRVADAPVPVCGQSEADFTVLVEEILEDNTHVVSTVARGVLELKAELGIHYTPQLSRNIKEALNRFFMSRTGLRFIMEQVRGSDENCGCRP